jgi:hypothetical protein
VGDGIPLDDACYHSASDEADGQREHDNTGKVQAPEPIEAVLAAAGPLRGVMRHPRPPARR